MKLLKSEIVENNLVETYETRSGRTVKITKPKPIEGAELPVEEIIETPSIQEQILAENQYQTMLLELLGM